MIDITISTDKKAFGKKTVSKHTTNRTVMGKM